MNKFNLPEKYHNRIRIPRVFKLGAEYMVFWNGSNKPGMRCRFIQASPKGFNLLNLNTSKCILKQHLYRSKLDKHKDDTWFWVNSLLQTTQLYE